MNNTSKARPIAFLGVTFALIFVFLLVETYIFSAFFGAFTPAALTIPLAVSLSVAGLKRPMFVGGTLLGLASFLLAIFIANPVFINPLVSILPRIFIGVTAFGTYRLMKVAFKNAKSAFFKDIFPCSVAGVIGTVTNTVCTVFMMWVFNEAALSAVLTTVLSVNFVAEVIASAILCPVYIKILDKLSTHFYG